MEQLFSPNFDQRPENSIIDSIIIHYTEVSKEKTIEIFQDGKTKLSSHYLIDRKGEVINFVDIQNRAWHAGVSYWNGVNNLNDNSIGIELENNGREEYTQLQYKSLIKLITELKERFITIQDRFILGHADIAPYRKDDPGKYFLWELLFKNNIGIYYDMDINNNQATLQKGDMGAAVINCQKLLYDFGYDIKIDGLYDSKTEKIVTVFKTHYCRKKIDGIWDHYSSNVIKKITDTSTMV